MYFKYIFLAREYPLRRRGYFFVRQRLQHRFFRSGAYGGDHAEHQQQDAAQGQQRR